MIGLLRFLIPVIIGLALVYFLIQHLNKRAEIEDRKDRREHERKLERERRQYDTLIEYVQDKEFEEELESTQNQRRQQ